MAVVATLGINTVIPVFCLPGKAKNASYIEDAAAIAAYGLKENTKIFDDIKPERYGEVTAAGSAYYAFKDATMNFDLNERIARVIQSGL